MANDSEYESEMARLARNYEAENGIRNHRAIRAEKRVAELEGALAGAVKLLDSVTWLAMSVEDGERYRQAKAVLSNDDYRRAMAEAQASFRMNGNEEV